LNNPLLEKFELPLFSRIKPEHIKPAMEQILADNRLQIKSLEELEAVSWNNLIEPLELMDDRLNKAWSPVRHLNSVQSSDELRQMYNDCLPLLSEYSTEISQNQTLFKAYQTLSCDKNFANLSQAQQKAIRDSLLYFKLGGVDLSGEDKQKYQTIQKRLTELQSRFENNVLDATQAWDLHLTDKERLGGLPDYAVNMLQQNAEQKSLGGYRLTLNMPCYIAVITYAQDRALRKQIYEAFTTRASNEGEGKKEWDNGDIMVEILQKRLEKAQLLGFNNYTELSLQLKMASSYEEVINFLTDLSEKGLPAARLEFQELQDFATEQGFDGELMAWDVGFYSEKLKQQRYSISNEDLKPYFSDNKVIQGLLKIAERLYQIKINEVKEGIDVWHEDVRFYQILDSDDEVCGKFYLDLYARENKRGGAWMDECANRYVIQGHKQIPVAYLVCNLTPPIGDQPALFTHDEVITLFHEFGHGLHHLLTRIDVPEVSGINGVEWDAVELPSQFMENFCWQREPLDLFARHHETGEPLPDGLFDKMIQAKNFQSAMQMQRQLEFSMFDMRLHEKNDIQSADQVQHILNEVRDKVSVLKPPAFNKFQNGFTHIFAGGYAAGYYSYKWAEVLSSDAFSRFEEQGIFDTKTGIKFLTCILQQGGARPARESFVSFMGREPEIDALLRHNGIQ
jgi:oligopeptidase A